MDFKRCFVVPLTLGTNNASYLKTDGIIGNLDAFIDTSKIDAFIEI